jgi:hypothetical protein
MYHAPVHLELGRQLQNVRTIYRGGLKDEKIMAPASDPVSWNRYLILIKAAPSSGSSDVVIYVDVLNRSTCEKSACRAYCSGLSCPEPVGRGVSLRPRGFSELSSGFGCIVARRQCHGSSARKFVDHERKSCLTGSVIWDLM